MTFKDLNEMYQLSFDDNYFLGFLDIQSGNVDYLGIKSEKFTNTGVILLNLEKIRNDNKTYEIINALNSKLFFRDVDQSLGNIIFYPKIGQLPDKFGIWNLEFLRHRRYKKIFV